MRNWPWGFWLEREQRVDDIPLDLEDYDHFRNHLSLDNDADLNLLSLQGDVKDTILKGAYELWDELKIHSRISLWEVLRLLWVKTYEIGIIKFGASKKMQRLWVDFYASKNSFWDLNISSDVLSWSCNGKTIHLYCTEKPWTIFQNLMRKVQKKVVYRLDNK